MLNLREDEKTRTLCKPRIKSSNDAVEQKRGVVSETKVALDTETKSSIAVVRTICINRRRCRLSLAQGRSSRPKGPKAGLRLLGSGHRAPSPLAKESAWVPVALNSRARSGGEAPKEVGLCVFLGFKNNFLSATHYSDVMVGHDSFWPR